MTDEHVVVGRVAGAFGVRGALRVESWTQPFDNLCRYNPWYIRIGDAWHCYEIKRVSVSAARLVANIEGITDRTEAQRLYNADIAIKAEQLEPLPPGEHYWFQLIGLRVVNTQGKTLGVVDSLTETGANAVLIVKSSEGERLIPYIKERVVRSVDMNEGVITVEWEADW